MTTPDQQPESASTTGRVESPTTAPGTSGEGTSPRAETTESSTETPGPAAASTHRSTDPSSSPVEDQRSTDASRSPVEDQRSTDEPGRQPSVEETESASDQTLFGEDELSVLRSRWDEVQAGFVDDPRECVQKADGLVSDVVDRITTGFSESRSRLEEQWARGEEGSTEDLRLALKRYREFFQRLLAL
ncbi:hypothetical protein CBI38_13810 [Rhodococcus oxybenzonivorans]|uniref:Uncharacterized protein n=1 Tax=Rhodococcus oxybenzonivorans TaxID=1990687 RepID=A0A2S2BV81_9NOCA|nr:MULTISPECIES: hypothetical protein [Rhodococcus]AWK72493.1 hypothetical protein CBI38_13810 [Rhodococcus oxybenzonivorans]